ncbi:MAG: Ldh family oxidoreductase, partial [Gemmatimonadetes bacterium]|nr:Ldh family oxidoreductase [Gemmatimonadota bacterium]
MTESTRQNIQPDDLKAFCTAAMVKAGLSQEDAALSAHVFVTTDTWGTFTHGTRQIRGLMQNARRGRLVATAKEKIVAEGPSWAIIDACDGMPPSISYRSVE